VSLTTFFHEPAVGFAAIVIDVIPINILDISKRFVFSLNQWLKDYIIAIAQMSTKLLLAGFGARCRILAPHQL
jgi:hypothetical protein